MQLTTTNQTTLQPQNFEQAMNFAQMLAKSNMVPRDFQGKPENILVAIQWGQEIGLAPMQAMQNIAVINGRPSIWGDAAIALVRGSGLLESINEEVTDAGATCTIKRKGEPEAVRTFTVEDAKRAGKWGGQGPWTQYPKRMLQMRARSWAIRDVFADVLRGVSIAEEAQDIDAQPTKIEATVKPKTSKDKLVAALAKPEAKPENNIEVSPVNAIINAFNAAQNAEELKDASTLATELEDEADKQKAREAYSRRQKELAEAK